MGRPTTTSVRGREVLKRVRRIRPFIQGSFTTTMKRCGNPRCRCAVEGPIHETTLLTWKEGNRTRTLYVPVRLREEVERCIEEGKLLKRLILEMSEAQRAFLVDKRRSSKR
jgi:hypothetical protein